MKNEFYSRFFISSLLIFIERIMVTFSCYKLVVSSLLPCIQTPPLDVSLHRNHTALSWEKQLLRSAEQINIPKSLLVGQTENI